MKKIRYHWLISQNKLLRPPISVSRFPRCLPYPSRPVADSYCCGISVPSVLTPSVAGWLCARLRAARDSAAAPKAGRRARGAARSRVGPRESVAPAAPSDPDHNFCPKTMECSQWKAVCVYCGKTSVKHTVPPCGVCLLCGCRWFILYINHFRKK